MRQFSACTALLASVCLTGSASAAVGNASPLVVSVPPSARVDMQTAFPSARDILVRAAATPAQVQLVPQHLFSIGSLRVYRFDQLYNGLPVVGRGGALVSDSSGKARFGTLRVEDRLPDSTVPALTADNAAAVAAQRAGIPAVASNARLLIWPTPSGGRLAWSVLPPSLLPIPYAPLVIVDATSGEVLSFQNMVRHKNLAHTFQFNPVSTPNEIEATLPIADLSTVPQNSLVKSYNCVDTHQTQSISYMGIPFTVHVCSMLQNAEADGTTGDYTQYDYVDDTSGGDPFSEISIFYHANKAYDFFKAFDPTFVLQGKSNPLFLVANLMLPAGLQSGDLTKMSDPNTPFDPFDNAFFSGWDPTYGPMTSTLWPQITGAALMFGQGAKVDYAYDGDVVYHEFTHAVVDSTLKLAGTWHLDSQGATPAPGAMNEGIADYFSSAITGDPNVGEYAGQPDAIRHIDNDFSCPSHLAGEVHFDSEFFSAALWATRAGLGNDDDRHTFDEAIFTAMSSGPTGDLGYDEVANLFITGIQNSPLGATVAQQLQSAFEARGVLPHCARTVEWSGTPISSNDPDLHQHFTSGGTSNFIVAMPYAPGVFQAHVPLAADAAKLQASFSLLIPGGGNPLPTGNTPYAPAFLVSFDQPIAFDISGSVKANTDVLVAATKSSTVYSADIDIPAGSTSAYVMVVNKGQTDGYYTQLTFKTLNDVTAPDAGADAAGDSGGDQPDAAVPDAPDDAAQPGAQPQNAAAPSGDSGGCGCQLPAHHERGAGALALLVALAGSIVARRRKADTMSS